jgi:RHO1 GDP-GTP exchange protein 1/2
LGRQEVIFEIINTEKEFVKDLENTIKYYVEPLRIKSIIPSERREQFIHQVFSNIKEICAINTKLLQQLLKRQEQGAIVDTIGDVFVGITHELGPYVEYGAQQVYAKNILDEEKSSNPEFLKFLKETEKIVEFRKLPIESFLARAITRLGRYPLLLKPVMEKGLWDGLTLATDNHPDKTLIPQALGNLKRILLNINVEAGKAENIVRLAKLQKQIIPGNDEDNVFYPV